jgi:hypothetical protein
LQPTKHDRNEAACRSADDEVELIAGLWRSVRTFFR